jgi:hypothetical protein
MTDNYLATTDAGIVGYKRLLRYSQLHFSQNTLAVK